MNRTLDEPRVRCLLAPNPGPMTLDGTNTWLIGTPDSVPPVVVDPGPADAGHLDAVLDAAGGRIAVILITHRHADHTAGAAALAERAGCAVRAVDPTFRVGAVGRSRADSPAGDVVEVGEQRLEIVATPGHTDDSVIAAAHRSRGPPAAHR